MKKTEVRYPFGRIHATVDYGSFQKRPMGELNRMRVVQGNVLWSSGNYSSLIPSEALADELTAFLKEKFLDCYVADGISPLSSVHGMGSYEKYLILRVTEKERAEIRKYIANKVGKPEESIETWIENITGEQMCVL